jgi:hypothetical protein
LFHSWINQSWITTSLGIYGGCRIQDTSLGENIVWVIMTWVTGKLSIGIISNLSQAENLSLLQSQCHKKLYFPEVAGLHRPKHHCSYSWFYQRRVCAN